MLRRIILLLSFIVCQNIVAQEDTQSLTTFRLAYVYAGPSLTYPQVGVLSAGRAIQVIERNHVGTWIRIQEIRENEIILDGWIISGYLNFDPNLQYGDLPISDLPDAMPESVNSESLSTLYSQAIIPPISDAMIQVFERGQANGNYANVITKVGDSNAVSEQFINIFSVDNYILGSFSYLEDTLLFYRDSTSEDSVATQIGMSSYVVFDSMWADNELCLPEETPLSCEYRLKRPSIAFIHFGHNDVRSMDEINYNNQMRRVIEESLESGVIPVLMTFANHPDDGLFWQGINLNLELLALAEEYDVPLINLWAASQHLPQCGLEADNVHLTHSGFRYLKYDTGHEAFYGVSL